MKLLYDVNEKPTFGRNLLFAVQQLLAIIAATLLVPTLVNLTYGEEVLNQAAALFGAAFLVVVDDIARLAYTGELPLGILTAFVGAPIFLYLLLTGGARRGN